MSVLISTEKVSLDTLSVTIQALHVSGKQMTLAVFRQLPEAQLYSMDGSLLGKYCLWGITRYQIIKGDDIWWVVASADGKLFRCPTNSNHEKPSKIEREIRLMESEQIMLRAYREKKEANEKEKHALKTFYEQQRELEKACPISEPDLSGFSYFDQLTERNRPKNKNIYLNRSKWIAERVGNMPPLPDAVFCPQLKHFEIDCDDEFCQSQIDMTREHLADARRAEASRKLLMNLPQLFIAI